MIRLLNSLFARGLDRFFQLGTARRHCSLRLAPDLFEGNAYTMAAFCEYVAPYFDTPSDFFTCFKDLADVRMREGPPPKSAPNADYQMMIFDSPIKTAWPENNVVPFKWFRGRNANTALLFAPGWRRRGQMPEEHMCRRLSRHGVDVVLLTNPFHQTRTPKGSYSGEYFISANLFLTIQNFRQFVAEIRLITRFLRGIYERVGIIGLSSGGFHAGLAAVCEPFDYLFPMITGCNLGRIIWRGSNTQNLRQELIQRGLDEGQLERAWGILDLAFVGRHCRAQLIKQYISLYDLVIPTKHQLALWHVYGRPSRRVLQASHYSSYLFRNEVIDDIAKVIASDAQSCKKRRLDVDNN